MKARGELAKRPAGRCRLLLERRLGRLQPGDVAVQRVAFVGQTVNLRGQLLALRISAGQSFRRVVQLGARLFQLALQSQLLRARSTAAS